jgi:hypothetical protein
VARASETFEAYDVGSGITGESWEATSGGLATAGTGETLPPVVAEDTVGVYLASGTPVLGLGSFAMTGKVTRVALYVELGASGIARVIMPLREGVGGDFDYVMVDAVRLSDDTTRLVVRVTDRFLGLTDAIIATADLATDASLASRLTVEAGPRFLRAWWSNQTHRFMRSEPDIGAHVPEIHAEHWGFMTSNGKTRRVLIETEPLALPTIEDPNTGYKLEGTETDADAEFDGMDTSSVALLTYTVIAHTKRRRAQVGVAMHGEDSDGTVADHIFHRLDPTQTLILAPLGEEVTIYTLSLAERRAGAQYGEATLQLDADPTGSDGGIGSGRSTTAAGGELYLDPGIILQQSGVIAEHQDFVSDTGGDESREQAASRQRRGWEIDARMRPLVLRRTERAIAACGGVRPIWFIPPLDYWPVPVIVPDIQHSTVGQKRADVKLTPAEV